MSRGLYHAMAADVKIRDSVPGKASKFVCSRKRPHRLWDPPSTMLNG